MAYLVLLIWSLSKSVFQIEEHNLQGACSEKEFDMSEIMKGILNLR